MPNRGFTPGQANQGDETLEALPVLDLLIAVLGTSSIVLMAAYAALCDRI